MNSNNRFRILAFILVFVAIIVVFLFERKKINERTKNANYTTGVLVGINESAKGSRYVNYTFLVDNMQYKGSINTGFCDGCKNECCEIGSKVKVRYDKTNPANNDLVY